MVSNRWDVVFRKETGELASGKLQLCNDLREPDLKYLVGPDKELFIRICLGHLKRLNGRQQMGTNVPLIAGHPEPPAGALTASLLHGGWSRSCWRIQRGSVARSPGQRERGDARVAGGFRGAAAELRVQAGEIDAGRGRAYAWLPGRG
jgi:hypothetical protein